MAMASKTPHIKAPILNLVYKGKSIQIEGIRALNINLLFQINGLLIFAMQCHFIYLKGVLKSHIPM